MVPRGLGPPAGSPSQRTARGAWPRTRGAPRAAVPPRQLRSLSSPSRCRPSRRPPRRLCRQNLRRWRNPRPRRCGVPTARAPSWHVVEHRRGHAAPGERRRGVLPADRARTAQRARARAAHRARRRPARRHLLGAAGREFATGAAARQVIARWENDSPGQAPLDLRVNDGELVLHGGEGHPSGPRTFTRTLGPAPIGEWTQLRVLVRFSADPDKAAVSVWRDGRSVVDDDHPRGGTLYPGQQSYLKVGLHRDRTIAAPSTVRFSAWRIDHGRAAADPDPPRARLGTTPPQRCPVDRVPRMVNVARRRSGTFGPARLREVRSGRVRPGRRSAHADHPARHFVERGSNRDVSDGSSERRSIGSSEPEDRSSRSDTSPRRTSERSSQDGSDRDDAQDTQTIRRGTSWDRTSRREESEDSSTSEHRSEPRRPSSQRDGPLAAHPWTPDRSGILRGVMGQQTLTPKVATTRASARAMGSPAGGTGSPRTRGLARDHES